MLSLIMIGAICGAFVNFVIDLVTFIRDVWKDRK